MGQAGGLQDRALPGGPEARRPEAGHVGQHAAGSKKQGYPNHNQGGAGGQAGGAWATVGCAQEEALNR